RIRQMNVNNTLTTWSASVSSTQDATSPTASVMLDSGAAYTNSTVVTVDVSASDPGTTPSGVDAARIDSGFGYGAWLPTSGTLSTTATVPAGYGPKTVYVQARDV